MSAKELFAALLSIDNNVRSEAEVRIFYFLNFLFFNIHRLTIFRTVYHVTIDF